MSVLQIKDPNTGEWIPILALKGQDGYTPVKGTDYFTESDKEEIVNDVLAEVEIPSVEGYATEDYVNSAIGAIEIPEVDLTGYATENYVDDAVTALEMKPLTFTGAVEATYDGSEAVSVEIPSGGEVIADIVTTEEVQVIEVPTFNTADMADITITYYVPNGTTQSDAVLKLNNEVMLHVIVTSNPSNHGAGVATFYFRKHGKETVNMCEYSYHGAGLKTQTGCIRFYNRTNDIDIEFSNTSIPFPIGTRLTVVKREYQGGKAQ